MTWELVLLVILVFAVAFIYSNLGLGGGLLYVPIMLSLAFTGPGAEDIAVPTSLTMTTVTGLSATINHYEKNLVDFRLALILITGALVGAVIGAFFNLSTSKPVFLALFITVIVLMGIKMLYDWKRGRKLVEEDDDTKMTTGRKVASAHGTLGSGFTSGSLGIGGGLVNVPLMVYVLGRNTRKAIGTSSLMIIFTSLFGFFSYMLLEPSLDMDFGLIGILVPVVFVGAFIGSRWGLRKLKTRSVALIFILVLFIAAGKMAADLILAT